MAYQNISPLQLIRISSVTANLLHFIVFDKKNPLPPFPTGIPIEFDTHYLPRTTNFSQKYPNDSSKVNHRKFLIQSPLTTGSHLPNESCQRFRSPQESLLNVNAILNLLYYEINHAVHDIWLFFELKVIE